MSICKAPHTSMYFTVDGYCSPCWLSSRHYSNNKWSEKRSIHDLWFNSDFAEWRENKWPLFCEKNCKNNNSGHCQTGNLITAYKDNTIKIYPTMMELELSNKCNLRCVMCNETLSSSIRKEKQLPPLPDVYTDKFVKELEEFIPHLEEIRLNGGEPLLHPIVYKIIEAVLILKPTLKLTIATNGTVWNKKIASYLKKGNIHVNISIDGMSKEMYEEIRHGSNFDIVMTNTLMFKDVACSICIMVNPMTINWQEMIQFVEFTNTHKFNLAYNTVRFPRELSLMYSNNLSEIWNAMKHQCDTYPDKHGQWIKFKQLVYSQIANWVAKK